MVDDRDAIAHPLDLGQQVAVQEDGGAGLSGASDDGPDVGAAHRVEGGRRLVEDDQAGCTKQRDGQPQPLLHALREGTHRVCGPVGQVDHAKDRIDVGRRGRRATVDRAKPGVQFEHLSRPEPGLVPEQFRQVADIATCRPVAERRPEHGPAATGRAGQPEQQFHGRGLARAVGPEEPEDLARLDAQGQVDQCVGAAVALGQPVGVDDRATRGGHRHAGSRARNTRAVR